MKKIMMLLSALTILLTTGCQPKTISTVKTAKPATTLTGKITEDGTGAAVVGAYVYAYRKTNTHFFGPPDYMSTPSDKRGEYKMELPVGDYFIMARKRQSGNFQGPLFKEDYFGDMPTKTIRIGTGINSFDLAVQKLAGQQFFRPEKISLKSSTAVKGQIIDPAGKPILGAYAFAYKDRFKKRMPPDYASMGSDEQGRYVLYLDDGGEYIIGARIKAKEPPEKGELLGFFQGSSEKIIKISIGHVLENINIRLEPFSGTPEVKPVPIPYSR